MRLNDKYDLAELASRVKAARKSTPPELGAFDAFQIQSIESVLESCVSFHFDIPDADRRGVILTALANAASRSEITQGNIVAELRKAESAYLRRSKEPFVLATSVTLPTNLSIRPVRLEGATIAFAGALPKSFDRTKVEQNIRDVTVIAHPERLLTARVFIKARTPNAAFHFGLESLDLLRGYWNVRINSGTAMRLFSGQEPVNSIRLGPVHTLHRPNGTLVVESFWFQPRDEQTDRPYQPKEWGKTVDFTKALRARIHKLHYARDFKFLLIRYCRALDAADPAVAFSKAWGVLEHLAGAVGKYDKLLDRVGFLVSAHERSFARAELEHLRDVRNGVVHSDSIRGAMDTYLYQLKWYIELLLRFHWVHAGKFKSIGVVGSYLDLPADPNDLRGRIADLKSALRFQTR